MAIGVFSLHTGNFAILLLRRIFTTAESGVGGGEAGDRHPERGAGDVVEADLVTEDDAGGITAMLTADAELDVGPGGTSLDAPHLDELADATLIESDEGIVREEIVLDI